MIVNIEAIYNYTSCNPIIYSYTVGFALNLLFFSELWLFIKYVNVILGRNRKLYGRKFLFFKGSAQLQTVPRRQKPAIPAFIRPFENANQILFQKLNSVLVKYQFWFSGRSTRFPCDIFQPTLLRDKL